MIRRMLGNFRADSRLLVINDEAHHCYLPKQDERVAKAKTRRKRTTAPLFGSAGSARSPSVLKSARSMI